MNYTPRPYQQEAIDRSVDFLRSTKGKNGMVVLPTGSGKSIVIAGIVKALGKPTLVFQPSKEILAQNAAKYAAYGYDCGIYSASAGQKKLRDVTFATVGSVVKKLHLLERFEYVIVDECHGVNARGGMYETVLSHLGVPTIGLTATPYRLTQETSPWDPFDNYSVLKFLTRTRPRMFDEVVYHVQNRELFEAGYLAKLKYYGVEAVNRKLLRRNSTGADYTDASVKMAYEHAGLEQKITKVVRRLLEIGRKNVLVFTRFVEEAAAVARAIPGAEIVTAETPPKERDRIIGGFRAGRIHVVCNVGILTTGFDYPELEAVVMARPTMSLALWYQVVGRGIRPHPNKDHTMVVDMGGNLRVFGKVEDLELSKEGGWHVRSGGRVLTGVRLDEVPNVQLAT